MLFHDLFVCDKPSSSRFRPDRRWLLPLLIASLFGVLLTASISSAGEGEGADPFFSCKRDYGQAGDLLRDQASLNLYNSLLYFGSTAAVEYGSNPSRHWSRNNGFDDGIRDGLRLGSTGARKDAALASDFTLVFNALVLPAAGIGSQFARTHDCVETWALFTDALESLSLTLFVTNVVKLAAGRNRPYTEECDGSPPSDAKCGSDGRHLSFFSGHASLAAAGAGVSCAQAIHHDTWGTSRTAKVAPCAVGAAFAITTGTLRMLADKHWGSDVLLGWAVGAAVGYFDMWGPFDLLKFSTHDGGGKVSSRGIVLPSVNDGAVGAQLMLVF